MMEIVCTANDAIELLQHMDKDDLVVLTVVNRRTHEHGESKKIKRENGETYIRKSNRILYQDNDFFGMFSLGGVVKDSEIVHNLLFPQKE